MIQAFVQALERSFPISRALRNWEDELEPPVLRALEACGLLVRRPMREGERYPCSGGNHDGCPMRIIETEDDQLVAVCGAVDQCDEVVIEPEHAFRLEADARSISLALSRLLELRTGPHGSLRDGSLLVGERSFGSRRAAFYFVANPSTALSRSIIEGLPKRALGGTELRAVVVPRSAAIDGALRQTMHNQGTACLSLEDCLRVEGGKIKLSMGRFIQDNRLQVVDPGADLWPDYWLVLDPPNSRYWLAGKRLDLESGTVPAKFLELLAETPSKLVTRAQIAKQLWPDDVPTDGPVRAQDLKMLADLFGTTVATLRRCVSGVELPKELPFTGDPDRLIRTVTGGKSGPKGFILELPAGRVVTW